MRRYLGWALGTALLAAAFAPFFTNASSAADGVRRAKTLPPLLSSLRDATKQRNATAPGSHARSMQIGGVSRHYLVVVPKGLSPTETVPVIVALHGIDQTFKNIENYSGFNDLAQPYHAVMIYPTGLHGQWNAGTCCSESAQEGVDDVGFIAAVIAASRKEFITNARHTYVVGFSNGGMMAYRYLCEKTSDVAGIGVVAATFVTTSSDGSTSSCTPSGTSRIIDIHGMKDTYVPYRGGYSQLLRSPLMPVPRALTATTLNDCQRVAVDSVSIPGALIRDGVDCSAGAQRLVTVASLDHEWTRDVKRYGLDDSKVIIDYLLGAQDQSPALIELPGRP